MELEEKAMLIEMLDGAKKFLPEVDGTINNLKLSSLSEKETMLKENENIKKHTENFIKTLENILKNK